MEPKASAELYAEHEKQDWSAKGIIHQTLYRPFIMLAMEPILVLITVYLSLVFGLLYARKYFMLILFSRVLTNHLQFSRPFLSSSLTDEASPLHKMV